MQIRNFEPMPTRPCKYCFALQDDAVFADFDIKPNGSLYLVRISFDGYGCCHPQTKVSELSYEKSKCLIHAVESGTTELPEVEEILRGYFRDNKEALWEDALKDHELV